VSGKLRLDLAQYRDLAAFAQFASDLDKATRDQLTRGERLSEILKQPQFQPLAVEKQVVIIWCGTNGYLDDVPLPKIRDFETGLYRFLESNNSKFLPAIAKEKALSDELDAQLREVVAEYRRQEGYGAEEEAAAGEAAKPSSEAEASAGDATPSGEDEPTTRAEASGEAEDPKADAGSPASDVPRKRTARAGARKKPAAKKAGARAKASSKDEGAA
jgi:F-type H+-transporting ATPase subunit alpha